MRIKEREEERKREGSKQDRREEREKHEGRGEDGERERDRAAESEGVEA